MTTSDIGIVLESFRQPVKDALQTAAQLDLRRVELPAAGGETEPAALSRSGRRHLLHYVSSLGLELSALGGDVGGTRFNDAATIEQRLDTLRQIMEMAAQLRTPVVTTHLGPVEAGSLERGPLREVVEHLANVADRTGTRLAFETGSADPATIARLLREVDCPLLGACYDPASLLIDGYEPLEGVGPLADRILIARARDAVAGAPGRPGRETPLGRGQVDLAEYLAALDQAGYRGIPFIRRTGGEHPVDEVAEAKARIESLLG